MRLLVALVFSATALDAGVAQAQAQTSPAPAAAPAYNRGYVEGVAQSAFGNVTSQSYGVEAGYTFWRNVQVFVDAGRTRSVAPSDLGTSVQTVVIPGLASSGFPGASFTAKEPVTFAVVGARYPFRDYLQHGLEPYVLGGVGVARVTKDVRVFVNGTDISSALENPDNQYGVLLGTDLSGTTNNAMLVFGGGVAWPVWRRVVIDFQYRYGRIFTEDINVSRAGAGIGVRF